MSTCPKCDKSEGTEAVNTGRNRSVEVPSPETHTWTSVEGELCWCRYCDDEDYAPESDCEDCGGTGRYKAGMGRWVRKEAFPVDGNDRHQQWCKPCVETMVAERDSW